VIRESDGLADRKEHLETCIRACTIAARQTANTAVHMSNDEHLSRFYNRLASRKNSQKAIVAAARKMLVSIYHMLDRGDAYDPPGVTA
jgi:hypothetical protein